MLAADPVGAVNDIVEERLAFGLPADAESIRAATAEGLAKAQAEWGVAMTETELASVDLQARMAFAQSVAVAVLPQAQSLDTYAGAYIDQANDGSLVILLTSRDEEAEQKLRSLLPAPTRSIEFREVPTSYAQLEAAMREAWSADVEQAIGAKVVKTAIDERGNQVRVWVEGRAPDQASEDKAQAGLGVRISVNTGSIEDPAVCNSRDDCHTPMRAGIRIVNNANKGCSMGFMISKGSDPQFMTTGHCSFNSGTSWSHTGYGPVGAVLETEYQNNRWDIMRVAMPDNEATNRIYAEVRRVQGRRDPIQGEAVCASLGRTDALACGTIADADVAYNDGNGLHIVNATDLTGINIQGGDSGSPVYVRSSTTQVIAVALAATDTSDLASKLGLPLSHWSADVVYGGP